MINGKKNKEKDAGNIGPSYFLSEILGAKIICQGKKIGRLDDVLVDDNLKLPEVTHFYITRPFGDPSLYISWDKIKEIDFKRIIIDVDPKQFPSLEKNPKKSFVPIRDFILDKKVLDVEDREVEVVYDIKLTVINKKLHLSDVDLSRYGLLRRIGLKGLANFIYKLANKIKGQTISWTYIRPLPAQLGSFQGNVKLKVLKETLSDIPPVDLADILEELDHDQRMMIFSELEPDQASDTLEEIDPHVQRSLISSMKKEKVVALLDDMTPGQAADILSILPYAEAREILSMIKGDDAVKIKALLDHQEERILNLVTDQIIKVSPNKTVTQIEDEYRYLARDKDLVMYIYVVDENDCLKGVLDIKELFQAPETAKLTEIMTENIISLHPTDNLKDASELFSRYGFRAIPVVDEDTNKIHGVIPYRDVMNLKHRFLD